LYKEFQGLRISLERLFLKRIKHKNWLNIPFILLVFSSL